MQKEARAGRTERIRWDGEPSNGKAFDWTTLKRTGVGLLSRPPSDGSNHAFTPGVITMASQTPSPIRGLAISTLPLPTLSG
jgi:hypothetical protein